MAEIELLDLDSVEIVTEVERAFRITISNAEAQGCSTVGDLFAVVVRKIPIVDRGALTCPNALAFWRLRRAMRRMAPGKPLRPSTPINDLVPIIGRRAWWRELERSTGFVSPSTKPSQRGLLPSGLAPGLAALLIGGLSLDLGAGGWSILIGATVALVVMLLRGRTSDVLGMDVGATLGDLTKITASLNVGLLAESNGSIRTREAWDALEGVIRNFTAYPGPMDKRTKFRCV